MVRFGYRDYDPATGRFTAPDPLGDTGGDHDPWEYCVDDPVNSTDPLGLWPWDNDADPEEITYYIWKSNPGACDKCLALDGTIVENPDDPQRPHPNCKCLIIKCTEHFEFSEWKIVGEKPPTYEVYVAFYDVTGVVGTASWTKAYYVKEKRTKLTIRECEQGHSGILNVKNEYRTRKKLSIQTP